MRNKPSQVQFIYFIAVLAIASRLGVIVKAEDAEPRSAGPDVIVGGVAAAGSSSPNDSRNWGASGDIRAYSVGITACDIGNTQVLWQQSTPRHPINGQNLFRLANGRFEQIGQAWVIHHFCALGGMFCGECPDDPDGCPTLDPGCSDSLTSTTLGNTGAMGPKWQVNASTGVFIHPHPGPSTDTPATIRGRLQVQTVDITPSMNPGSLYFVELQFVTEDDAMAGNKDNNASRRRVVFDSLLNMSFPEPTVQQEPAILAWPIYEPIAQLKKITVINDGRFWMGYKVTEVTPGVLWHYEYAIHNLNSHRSGQSFSIPLPAGVGISNIGFHDVDYHSGEPVIGTDWSNNGGVGGTLTWQCDAYTPANELTANALRWGTLYNFRFDANSPPQEVAATIGLFRPGQPGDPSSVNVTVQGPSSDVQCHCSGDLDGSATVDGGDISIYVEMFLGSLAVSNCADMASPNGGNLDVADTTAFIDRLMQPAPCP